jgi:MOSC domain-containing protein YiiM
MARLAADEGIDMTGTLIAIHIADQPGGPLRGLEQAELVAGRGIVGDRNFDRMDLSPRQEITLIEAESVDWLNGDRGLDLRPEEMRRNLVTRGVDLNGLVGVNFAVGTARLRGLELCEPCAYLAGLLQSGRRLGHLGERDFVRAMVHRAGLRARILDGGSIRTGEPLAPC